MRFRVLVLLGCLAGLTHGADCVGDDLTFLPRGNHSAEVRRGGQVVTTLSLSSNGVLTARQVTTTGGGIRWSDLRCQDPAAVQFAADDYLEVVRRPGLPPLIRFQLTLVTFDAARWQALFGAQTSPFHFLCASVPTAQVWHQRGWLNATPNADPFPLLQDVHANTPEISSLWNRNWSYLCPLGAHPIPMIGGWDPPRKLYVGYDFQAPRATDQSDRYVATAYCWKLGADQSFFTLAWPYGGLRYGELVYPHAGDRLASRCELIVDTDLPDTEDPNERFQRRLFARYAQDLPSVPDRSDVSWVPGRRHLTDFPRGSGLRLFGQGGETTFYPAGTVLLYGWRGHVEMPVDAALRRQDTKGLDLARQQLETLLRDHAKRVTVGGEPCLFWEKPLQGAWNERFGGQAVNTLHATEGWYAARVLVELYRADRAKGQAKPEYLEAIDQIYNWTRHFVWTRNEFADVPSSPFAIGCTLSTAFLMDYAVTFRDDPARRTRAAEAVTLANRITWRYLPIWAMDSDRFDGDVDGSFLLEPNSGRDWAGLACCNEVQWVVETMAYMYVHSGDERLGYYLRGLLQRWPRLYQPLFEDSVADLDGKSMTEGYGLFDGAGPGRGGRYPYGSAEALELEDPVGDSKVRVLAGLATATAFCRGGAHSEVIDYRSGGPGNCSFRLKSDLPLPFDVSFTYPFADVSQAPVSLTRDGQTRVLTDADLRRPAQSPSSLYLRGLKAGDQITIGAPVTALAATAKLLDGGDRPATAGAELLAVAGDTPLVQDWFNPQSFAGLWPGLRFAYGVPYRQTSRGAAQPVAVKVPAGRVLFVLYAPGPGEPPQVKLDNGSTVALSGRPAPAWKSWPPVFHRVILMDQVTVPAGRTARQLDPRGALIMAATAVDGGSALAPAALAALASAAPGYAAQVATDRQVAELQRRLADLPAGRIAVLPEPSGGPAANFLALTKVRSKLTYLSGGQLIDPTQFNAQRFPVTLYLSGETYVKTVKAPGDAQEALVRYLAAGGTLVLLPSGPLPFFYGQGPGEPKKGEAWLAKLGFPIANNFEQPPTPGFVCVRAADQLLALTAARFDFPTTDPRLRAVLPERVAAGQRFTPLVTIKDAQGRDCGAAAGFMELGAGPAKGGTIYYVWSSLLTSPQGTNLLADTMAWVQARLKR